MASNPVFAVLLGLLPPLCLARPAPEACNRAATPSLSGVQVRDRDPEPMRLELPEILKRMRRTLGTEALSRLPGAILMKGMVRRGGSDDAYELLFVADGRFRESIAVGAVTGHMGFDGETMWTVDWSGMPYIFEAALRESDPYLLATWLKTGQWLTRPDGLEISLVQAQEPANEVILRIRLKGGGVERWLIVDRGTWRPRAICEPDTRTRPLWELEDYTETQGCWLPRRITERTSEGPAVATVIAITDVVVTREAETARFSLSKGLPQDTRFDDGITSRVETQRAKTGHILIKPRIDGRDAGWFVLDSGTSHMVIDPAAAESLGLRVMGQLSGWGRVNDQRSELRVYQAEQFELGPLCISKLHFIELPMRPIAQALGDNVTGICGYDLFQRAVVEVFADTAEVRVFDPAIYEDRTLPWQDIYYTARLPHVRCRFGRDHEALFLIDMGSDVSAKFYGPAVEAFGLLDKKGKAPGGKKAGSPRKPGTVRRGTLDLLRVGGVRLRNLQGVYYEENEKNAPYDPLQPAGDIGLGVLMKFKVVFDYPNKRVAFVRIRNVDERKPTTSSGSS